MIECKFPVLGAKFQAMAEDELGRKGVAYLMFDDGRNTIQLEISLSSGTAMFFASTDKKHVVITNLLAPKPNTARVDPTTYRNIEKAASCETLLPK
jgi:hypothetical protein